MSKGANILLRLQILLARSAILTLFSFFHVLQDSSSGSVLVLNRNSLQLLGESSLDLDCSCYLALGIRCFLLSLSLCLGKLIFPHPLYHNQKHPASGMFMPQATKI